MKQLQIVICARGDSECLLEYLRDRSYVYIGGDENLFEALGIAR